MADEDLAQRRALEDEWIAVRCQLGEREAFDELIQRWHGPIWQYVRSLTDEDAEQDINQDIWLRVLRGIGGLRDPAKLRPWLFGIAHRTWIDTLRKKYRIVVADMDAAVQYESPDPMAPEERELELAALESKTGVDEVLRNLIEREEPITKDAVESGLRVPSLTREKTDVWIDPVDLGGYDQLLDGALKVACAAVPS